jgi:hypothetical protein
MGSRGAIVALVGLCFASACTSSKTWTTSRVAGAVTGPARVESSPIGVSVVGKTSPDGGVHFFVQGGCDATATLFARRRVTRHTERKVSSGSMVGGLLVGVVGGVGGLGLGAVGLIQGDGTLAVVGAGALAVGVAATIALIRANKRAGKSARHHYTRSPLRTKTQPVACPAGTKPGPAPTRITVVSPWGASVTTPVRPASTTGIPVDWSATGIDPMAADAAARLGGAWSIRAGSATTEWTPAARDVANMMTALRKATGNDVPVVKGGPPPKIEVTSVRLNRGPGPVIHVVVSIRNSGAGNAYRVRATTKSSAPLLHKLRFDFGSLRPGATRSRRATVKIPAVHPGGTATVVLSLSELTNNAPGEVAKELSFSGGDRPILALSCKLSGGAVLSADKYIADAGARVAIACEVSNAGNRPAVSPRLTATLGRRGRPKTAKLSTIAPKKKATARLVVTIPKTARTGDTHQLRLRVIERSINASHTRSYPIEVGAQRICRPPISRAVYRKKLKKLEAMRKRGDIDKRTFRRYKAQLVSCLR